MSRTTRVQGSLPRPGEDRRDVTAILLFTFCFPITAHLFGLDPTTIAMVVAALPSIILAIRALPHAPAA